MSIRVFGGICALAVIAGGGCRPQVASPTEVSRLFGASFHTLNNPYFTDLSNGLRTRIEGQGDRLLTFDAHLNSLKQREDLVALLQQKPTAIFITPVDWEGMMPVLVEANRKNVPVIVVDTQVSDPDLVLCQVASDNTEAGRLACDALARVKPEAKLVILHRSASKSCIDRVTGFTTEMAMHPGMQVLDVQQGSGTAEGSRPVMRGLLERFPEVDAVFAINDPSALGAIAAIESAGRIGQISVVAVDGSRDGASAIIEGKMYATVAQYPREIGRLAAGCAYAHIAGKQVEKNIRVPVKLFTKENAAGLLVDQ